MTVNKKYKCVSVTGYGYTGSGAVVDLLREFRGYSNFGYEFRLLRDPDGIAWLDAILQNAWSDYNSDIAIKRFRKFTSALARKKGLFRKFGRDYNIRCNGKFNEITDKYINDLSQLSFRGYCKLHHEYDASWKKTISRKIKEFLGLDFNENIVVTTPETEFCSITKEYLNNIFSAYDPENVYNSIILDHGIPPYKSENYFKYFYDCKMILIDRDPRDNFMEALHAPLASFMPKSVDQFIEWYRMLRVNATVGEHENILKLRFEDLIYDYDETVGRILEFLNEGAATHVLPRSFFKPELSKKNVRLWERHKNQSEIEKIYNALHEYTYIQSR
jgi:hypothetical protein